MKIDKPQYRRATNVIEESHPIIILNLVDDIVWYHDEDKYNRRWQTRCNDCLAPCCFLSMRGYAYDYTKTRNGKWGVELDKMNRFWSYKFVIMDLNRNTWKENEGMGFNIQLDTPELSWSKGLQICPLNVNGKCTIYEDRPKMCREFKCQMALDKHLGVK